MIHVLIRPIKTGSPNIKEEKKKSVVMTAYKGSLQQFSVTLEVGGLVRDRF